MKKLMMVAIILMVGVGAAMAQKDVKVVGLNINYGTEISNLGIGAKFQYGLTDALRGEASFDYFLKKDGLSMWDVNVNLHYLFDVAPKVKVYPLVGIGYANVKVEASWGFEGGDDDSGDSDWNLEDYYSNTRFDASDYENEEVGGETSASEGKIAINLGAGAEYELTDKISIGAELKYQIISNTSQLVPTIGVTYKF